MNRVLTCGSFDALHIGHLNILKACSRLGDLVVGLNTDQFVYACKGVDTIQDYDTRREVLLATRYVVDVVPCEKDARTTVERVKPRYLCVGSDWARRDYYAQMGFGQDWLDDRGVILCFIPRTPGCSTTQLRQRMQSSGTSR